MHYYPFTPVNNIFNKAEDLIKHSDMENSPHSHPKTISKAINIINKTVKFQ